MLADLIARIPGPVRGALATGAAVGAYVAAQAGLGEVEADIAAALIAVGWAGLGVVVERWIGSDR